ncbi:hypothetical protein [Haladaptatus halobius]|uniref:hypothetical protein n=1 Tax=Haladaptatus halobius TaxID=2884875 RepID=UPI001D09B87F|nr:hypothetical protein [Haladaptatus halobius]
MFRGLLTRLTARFKGDRAADDEETEDSRFIPSVLDSSVRYSHGGSNSEGDREIAHIEEEAQRLSEHQRKK